MRQRLGAGHSLYVHFPWLLLGSVFISAARIHLSSAPSDAVAAAAHTTTFLLQPAKDKFYSRSMRKKKIPLVGRKASVQLPTPSASIREQYIFHFPKSQLDLGISTRYTLACACSRPRAEIFLRRPFADCWKSCLGCKYSAASFPPSP